MPISTGNFAKALWPGVNAWYGREYTEFKTEWPELFTQHKSRRAWEEDVGTSGFGLAVIKAEGAPFTYDTERQGYIQRYTHVEYGLGFTITRNMVEDDLYDVVGERRAKGLAFSMRQTKEIVGANVFNRGFNSTYTFSDGKEIFATDHPNVAGGTWANELATAADLSEAALEQACIDLQKFTNDRGLKIAVRPKKLVIPVDLWPDAEKLLETQYEVGTPNNTKSVIYKKFPYVVNHYLTDPDAWFILTDVGNGFKYFERRGDSFDSDNDFDTENAKFKASARYCFGLTDPRAGFASPGA
jgi:phage major head subunit gpT-like protein